MAIYQPAIDPEELRIKEENRKKQKKRKGKPVYAYIPAALYRKLDAYCEDTGMSKTHIIVNALEEYMKKDDVKRFSRKSKNYAKGKYID